MTWLTRFPAAALAGAMLLAPPARAADDPGVLRMEIALGESTPIGPPPVRNLICDDPSIVKILTVDDAPALKATAVGSTLCSFTDALSVRRVYRVVVKDGQSGGGPSPTGR